MTTTPAAMGAETPMPSSEARDVIQRALWKRGHAISDDDMVEVLRALAEAGIKCLGREPTGMMRDAPVGRSFVGDPFRVIWTMMWDAALPTAPSPTEPKDKP